MGFTKNQYRGGELPKKGGGLGQFVDLRGGAWQERGGVDTPMHTMMCGDNLTMKLPPDFHN